MHLQRFAFDLAKYYNFTSGLSINLAERKKKNNLNSLFDLLYFKSVGISIFKLTPKS